MIALGYGGKPRPGPRQPRPPLGPSRTVWRLLHLPRDWHGRFPAREAGLEGAGQKAYSFVMIYRVLADAVLIVHLLFILMVVFGGLWVLRRRKAVWIHLPVAAYGALISFFGWVCPLTPLENNLRRAAGGGTYTGEGFVEHYLLPVIYPGPMTKEMEIALGVGVILVNAAIYSRVIQKRRRQKKTAPE